jgi:aspartate carbamoyltransferase catalytic subunit
MVEQISPRGHLRHLISLADIERDQLEQILELAGAYMSPVGKRPPRDDILKGQTVANLFYEASTRTRASFELAAKRLSADVLNLDVNMSSRAKGESILDTIYTLQAMQVDIFVVRDAGTGVPDMIAGAVAPHVSVMNAGESDVSHPTQGLLDLLTIQKHRGDVSNLCVAIVGDIRHSRVARSAYQALVKFDIGEFRLVGPPELMPDAEELADARRFNELEEGIRGADVVMTLRIQKERFESMAAIPDSHEYFRRYGLTEQRLRLAAKSAIVMHPGPMNRGTEIQSSVADGKQSVIQDQVTNGLAVRMAVLAKVNEHVRAARGETQ